MRERLADWLAFRLCDLAAWWDRDVWDVPYWTRLDLRFWGSPRWMHQHSQVVFLSRDDARPVARWLLYIEPDWPQPDGWLPGRYV